MPGSACTYPATWAVDLSYIADTLSVHSYVTTPTAARKPKSRQQGKDFGFRIPAPNMSSLRNAGGMVSAARK